MVTTNPLPPAGQLHPENRSAVLASAVAAFATDPVFRWVWPDDERYQRCAPLMLGTLLDLRMVGGEVWTARPTAAVAMWNPPGGLYAEPDEDPWPLGWLMRRDLVTVDD